MKTIIDKVRNGVATPCGDTIYVTVADGKNLLLYRYVSKGLGYRGNTYTEDGYVLVFADRHDDQIGKYCPSFVSRRD